MAPTGSWQVGMAEWAMDTPDKHGQPLFQRLRRWMRGELVDDPVAAQVPLLTAWFGSDCGRLLLESEQQVLDDILPSLFGYHLLQMSVCETARLSTTSPIHHRVAVLTSTASIARQAAAAPGVALSAAHGCTGFLVTDMGSLPFESDSVDVVVLHHVLDFSRNPHQVLKEVHRVLIPRGYVVIVGFNPWSLFGLWKAMASLVTRQPQWRYSAITRRRLMDWFQFLDLEKTRSASAFFRPPCNSGVLLRRLSFLEPLGRKLRMPFGGVYVVVARKDVYAVTPIKAPWEKTGRRIMGLAPARPTAPRSYPGRPLRKDRLH